MTLEDATWPAVVLTIAGGVSRWAGKLIDRWFDAWIAGEKTRQERIAEGTKLIETLHIQLKEISDKLDTLTDRIDHANNGDGI